MFRFFARSIDSRNSQIPKLRLPEARMERFLLSEKTNTEMLSIRPGVGSGGRVARSRGRRVVYCCSIDRLRINALPPADFFGYFLVRRQESNTTAPQRFCTPKFLHNPCGMWKSKLWKNMRQKFLPQGLWKSYYYPHLACG